MRTLIALLTVLLLQTTGPYTVFAQSGDESLAIEAAEDFLILLDNGEVERAFDETSDFHRSVWVKEWWVRLNSTKRSYYGNLINRAIKSVKANTRMHGQPDGTYYSILFESSFEKKERSTERVELVLDKANTWKVTDYYLN